MTDNRDGDSSARPLFPGGERASKSERRAKDPVTNREYAAESIYRDHKPFQGVMWSTIRLDRRDGQDLEENSGRFELSEFQAVGKLEESSLARP